MSYPMNIGEAAQAAGVTAKMIRHYEGMGLIPEASRTDAGYRQYAAREVEILRFIRQSRSMGFSMKDIAQLLELSANKNRESREVKALARQHIAELDRKMQELAQMKAALEQLASGCHGDHRAACPILEELSNPSAPASAAPAAPRKAKARDTAKANASDLAKPASHGLDGWMRSLTRIATAEHA
jgi:MerR family copper efflux transcriptional regulator